MKLIHGAEEMRSWSLATKGKGRSIGFVPTMGFLHEGHLSLVRIAREQTDRVVVSIFVNPTQFGPNEDFDKYPRDEKRDLNLCEAEGVDVVYFPDKDKMYPPGYATYVNVKDLDQHLCGASRPGHFRGVTTVVSKLFNTVLPDLAVFGRKDAQQARIIERMTRDLDFGTRIVLGPILRENSGLAMSSRNIRLSEPHRREAPHLKKGIDKVLALYKGGERASAKLKRVFAEYIANHAPSGRIDYVETVDWIDLQPVAKIDNTTLFAVAVFFGDVRLIDNTLLGEGD